MTKTSVALKSDTLPTVAITPMDMLQIAVEQNADLDKLTKLMDLQERWQATEAKKAYVAAMSDFSAKCPIIDKTRTAHNSKYAGLAETLEQIRELLSECGLSHSWKTTQDNGNISVMCCVTHIEGHQECTSMEAGPDTSGSKNSIQALASTVTYLERYTLSAILGLASKEQDTDGNLPADTIDEESQNNILRLIEETSSDTIKFCRAMGIGSIPEMPSAKYLDAVSALERKRKQGEAK